MANGWRALASVLGGALIGVWLYGFLFGVAAPDLGAWGAWGLAGLLIASVLYLLRWLSPDARLVGSSVIGVTIGLAVAAARSSEHGLAALLLTVLGGTLTAASLPTPARASRPQPADEPLAE